MATVDLTVAAELHTTMHIDGRSLARDSVETCDVCIVGSGPAGYSVAKALQGSGLRVTILESGGMKSVTGAHNLSMLGTDSSNFVNDFQPSRRQIGGNASAWYIQSGGGHRWIRLAALSRADFDGVTAGDAGGWPLAHEEYMRWVDRADELFGLPAGCEFTPAPEAAPTLLNVPGEETRLYRFGDADRLLSNMRELYEQSAEIRLISQAYATELLPGENGYDIRTLRFATQPGETHRIEARTFVLAGGGIAIPQLMLASRSVIPEGIGNQNDTVGRWMMDHPLVSGGKFYPADPAIFRTAEIYDMHFNRGAPYMGYLTMPDTVQAQTGQIAMGSMMFAREAGWRPHSESDRQKRGVGGALSVLAALREAHLPPVASVVDAVTGADGIVRRLFERYDQHAASSLTRGGWSHDHRRKFEWFEILHSVEQRPNRNNRIALSRDIDAFGVPKAQLDWRWSDEDAHAVARAQDALADGLAAGGAGRFEVQRVDGKPVLYSASARHFMGSTRMSTDPRRGVVDPDCRVHGLANLFIASSSVFPTGGYANPTLSIVALGLRLGDYLRHHMQMSIAA